MEEIVSFSECSFKNISLVGGKSSSLGELCRIDNINSANGFTVTTKFYDNLLSYNALTDFIEDKYNDATVNKELSILELNQLSVLLKSKLLSMKYTKEQEQLLEIFYKKMPQPIELAVRSSAIAEDLPNASFAGQQDTYLNICSFEGLKEALLKCFASLFNANAISYRISNNIKYSQVKMAISVQKMIRSDLACAGVAFSLDTESGYSKAIVINSSFGLGESVVGGLVTPDEFIVDKRVCLDIKNGSDPVVSKKMGQKHTKVVFNKNGGVTELNTTKDESSMFSLKDEQIKEIGATILYLEKYYQQLHQSKIGVDVEWAYDGIDNKLYILQVRAETVHSSHDKTKLTMEKYIFNNENRDLLVTGVAVGNKISQGNLVYIETVDNIIGTKFEKGDILLTDMTTPDWEPIMKISGGIITNKGGRTCHAAIIAREHGINAVIGTINGTSILSNEKCVTLSSAEGETGKIYRGIEKFQVKSSVISVNKESPKIKKLMFNVGSPENAFASSLLPNNGVGLARMEFIINNYIKIHPLALLKKGESGEKEFISILSQGIAKIASAFYPKNVIVRLSDFKTNEYKYLEGGAEFEPNEENPMIGWRGASRYYSKKYEKAFRMECKALHYARETMKMNNIIIMIPFCRTPEECEKVINIMESEGLKRGVNGLQIYLMCEIPSNVIEADRFAPYIDGVSIGGNDLMQLTLGVDRDSEHIAYLNDDKNISFRRMIKMTIESYHEYGKKVGFCGQQPSNSSEFYNFLMDSNIDTISIIPDSIMSLL